MLTRKRKLILGAVVLLCVAIAAGLYSSLQYEKQNNTPKEKSFLEMTSRITPSQYKKIKPDMTYDEVVEMLGEEGFEYSRSESQVEYAWPGELYDEFQDIDASNPTVRVCFDAKTKTVTGVKEFNLLDGAEIYDNFKNNKEAITELTTEEMRAIRNQSDYKAVVKTVGCEGILIGSSTNINKDKTYRWKCIYNENGESKYLDFDMLFINNKYTPIYYGE